MATTMSMASASVKMVRGIVSANEWKKKKTLDDAETAMKKGRLAELARVWNLTR
jgi:uncharacterized protein (DUF2384 family)